MQTNNIAFSIGDVVAATSISRSLVYEEIAAGRLKTTKVGARTIVIANDLRAWLDGHRNAA